MRPFVGLVVLTFATGLLIGSCGPVGVAPPPGDHDVTDPDPSPPADPVPDPPTDPVPDPPTDPVPDPPTDPDPATPATTERISVSTDDVLANADSRAPVLAHDGTVVAFESDADNLVPGDTNGVTDVFVRDRAAGETERVSVATDGAQPDGASTSPSLSADGGTVAFVSAATNLVEGITNGVADVFVHDRATGVTERVSVADDGSEADAPSSAPQLGLHGRLVLFRSEATTLTPEGIGGLFVHDRDDGTTVRLPIDDPDAPWAVSADTIHVAYRDGVHVVVYDRSSGTTTTVTAPPGGGDPDGDTVPWSVGTNGDVAYHTLARNLLPGAGTETWHTAVYVAATGAHDLVSVRADGEGGGNEHSFSPELSPDGVHVVFLSLADDLVPDATHVGWSLYHRDRSAGTTQRIPVSSGPAQQPAYEHAISGVGRHVVFVAVAGAVVEGIDAGAELIDPHPQGVREVFLHGLE